MQIKQIKHFNKRNITKKDGSGRKLWIHVGIATLTVTMQWKIALGC